MIYATALAAGYLIGASGYTFSDPELWAAILAMTIILGGLKKAEGK